MDLLRLSRQDNGSIRRVEGRRRPLVEALEGRQLLSGFTATADIQGAHIGTNVTADIQGAHIGTNLMSRVEKWFY
jgi:hypothetical protein